MPRVKINQEVYYKSFRYTSKQELLHEFINDLDNANRYITSIIMSSKRYRSFLKKVQDDYSSVVAGNLND